MSDTTSANPLKAYLESKNLTLSAFGLMIGKGAADVHRYCLPFDHDDFRIPRPDTMRRIHEATGGEIDANSFNRITPSLGPRTEASEVGT